MRKKSRAESFRLVPKREFRGVLRLLSLPDSADVKASMVGKTVKVELRLPRARSCFPFTGNCILGHFFDKVINPPRR
jgi:hypothetical protein